MPRKNLYISPKKIHKKEKLVPKGIYDDMALTSNNITTCSVNIADSKTKLLSVLLWRFYSFQGIDVWIRRHANESATIFSYFFFPVKKRKKKKHTHKERI